jgi:glycosyl transferase family 1
VKPSRVYIVWNAPVRLVDSSIRYERYVRGFRALGHDACVVSGAAEAEGFPEAVHTVPTRAALANPALWAGLRPDIVLIPTWLGMSELLTVLRPHVGYIVALADSDGYLGARVHPWQLLLRMWSFQPTLFGRIRSASWWARLYLGAHAEGDAGVLASVRLCDRVVVFSPGARSNLRRFFEYHHEPAGERVAVAVYPVDEAFEREPVATKRAKRIVAIGRWEDAQKAPVFLARGLARYLREGGSMSVTILGSNGEGSFRHLREEFGDRVQYRSVVSSSEVAALLGDSRVLVSSSRWESGPIVACEALLRGCSLVGPASIPSFHLFCREHGCGSLFRLRSTRAFASALVAEERAWESGRRDPRAIADQWRGCFTPEAVCRALLDGLDAPTLAAGLPRLESSV